MNTQPDLGPKQKARQVQKRLRAEGFVGIPETLLLSGLFDLYEKVAAIEKRLDGQPQVRAKRDD
jgi:hypothetical protein